MAKATRTTKGLTTQKKIAAQREAARRAERRHNMLITGGSTAAVAVVVVVLVLVKVLSSGPSAHGAPPAGATAGTRLPASVMHDLTNVPAATLDAVGAGNVPTITQHPVRDINGTPLTSGGKPELLYIGAQWEPYSAAMRWAMAVALSRFGTFSPLRGTYSSSKDYFPHTPTLTFDGTRYSSPYLVFTPVEHQSLTRTPLQPTTPAEQALWDKYDPHNYPFIDIGGRYQVSIIYSAAYLAHQSWAQIASALHEPSTPIAQGADGAANFLTAAICKTTDNQPTSVCASTAIKRLQAGF
ncbi:MAG TPA: DUF929 family protein [Streptosporangiaceae bacterium]|nr:DUF929 family protein [Streptosporangiaceae bacterium]